MPVPYELYSVYLKEICEINKKYDCSSFASRSEDDIERSKILWQKMRDIDNDWDENHPMDPCSCGFIRKPSLDGICFNQNCSLAMKYFGG